MNEASVAASSPAPDVGLAAAGLSLPAGFLAGLAHETVGQLAALQASCFLLRKHGRDLTGAREQEWLNAIQRAGSQVQGIMDRVTLLERALLGGDAVTTVDLSFFLGDVAEQARAAAPASTVTLHVRVDPRGKWRGDSSLLEVALDCVLANALKFGPAESVAVLTANVARDRVEIVVQDAGRGVAPDEVGRLFDPFFQGRNAVKGNGCGLGLAIARASVTRLGGTISYRPSPDGGAEFCLSLPSGPPC